VILSWFLHVWIENLSFGQQVDLFLELVEQILSQTSVLLAVGSSQMTMLEDYFEVTEKPERRKRLDWMLD